MKWRKRKVKVRKNHKGHVIIRSGPHGKTGQVVIDGHDVSDICRAARVSVEVNDAVRVELELIGVFVDIEADGVETTAKVVEPL